jgi:hypothetical protein
MSWVSSHLTAGLTALETVALWRATHPEDELLQLLLEPYSRGVLTQAFRRAVRRVEVYREKIAAEREKEKQKQIAAKREKEKQTFLDTVAHWRALSDVS